jgi:hypothetical protein
MNHAANPVVLVPPILALEKPYSDFVKIFVPIFPRTQHNSISHPTN